MLSRRVFTPSNSSLTASSGYYQNVFTATSGVLINHNLGNYPTVMVMDSGLNHIDVEIQHSGLNHTQLRFNEPLTNARVIFVL